MILLCKNHSPDTCTELVIKDDNKRIVQEGISSSATLKAASICLD